MKILPEVAEIIYQNRIQKKIVPNEIVFVSLVGDLIDGNWQIVANPNTDPAKYDWRWVVDLQICLVYNSTISSELVKSFAKEIVKHLPNQHSVRDNFHGYLYLWNTEKQQGAHLTYHPAVMGDASIELEDIPECMSYRKLFKYETSFLDGVSHVR